MSGAPEHSAISVTRPRRLSLMADARLLTRVWPAIGWSTVAALAVLVFCLAVGSQLLADPDTQWHIASGRLAIESGGLLHADHFSFTFAQHPWIAKEWLSQLLLAAAYLSGSWQGVVLLTALAITLTFWLIADHNIARAGLAGGLAMGGLFFCLAAPTLLARPHTLVFPIIAGWTIAHLRSAECGRRPPWLALPLLVLWANMHGAFITGLVIAGAFGLEALFNAPPQERAAVLGRWLAFGAACLMAVIATPYGYAPLLLSLEMANHNEGMQYIGEWVGIAPTPRWALLLAMAAAALYVLAREPRQNIGRILLVAFLSYMMCKHQRFAMYFAIVASLVAGPQLVAMARDVLRRLGLFQSGFDVPIGVRSSHIAATLAAAAAASLVVLPLLPPPSAAPSAALASVPADVRQGRVFNSYDFGGFLTLHGVKTFIDGRTDQLFLGGFMSRLMEAASARDPQPLGALLDEYRIDWAIVGATKPESLIFPLLDGWRLHYKDDSAHVWVRQR